MKSVNCIQPRPPKKKAWDKLAGTKLLLFFKGQSLLVMLLDFIHRHILHIQHQSLIWVNKVSRQWGAVVCCLEIQLDETNVDIKADIKYVGVVSFNKLIARVTLQYLIWPGLALPIREGGGEACWYLPTRGAVTAKRLKVKSSKTSPNRRSNLFPSTVCLAQLPPQRLQHPPPPNTASAAPRCCFLLFWANTFHSDTQIIHVEVHYVGSILSK